MAKSVSRNQGDKKRSPGPSGSRLRARARKIGSCAIVGAATFAVVMAVSILLVSMYEYLVASPYFRLETVDVQGVDEEMARELTGDCGLDPGVSLLSIRLTDLKEQMEMHPWVRSVRLVRKFPHTLIVEVDPHVPYAIVLRERPHYMNRHGEVFKAVEESEPIDFPIITVADWEAADGDKDLLAATRVMQALEGETGLWSLSRLSEIRVGPRGSVSLYFAHTAAKIMLPEQDLPNKVQGFKKVAEHLYQTGKIRQVTGINMDYEGGAVVSFKKG